MTLLPDALRRRCRGAALRMTATVLLAGSAPPVLALAPGELGPSLTIAVSNTSDIAHAAALDPDGGIVIAGEAKSGAEGALARVTTTGAADMAFGTSMNGIIEYDLSTGL